MNPSDFYAYAATHNRVALTRRVLADLDTPLSLYLKLANAPNTFLLESVVSVSAVGAIALSACLAASNCA